MGARSIYHNDLLFSHVFNNGYVVGGAKSAKILLRMYEYKVENQCLRGGNTKLRESIAPNTETKWQTFFVLVAGPPSLSVSVFVYLLFFLSP